MVNKVQKMSWSNSQKTLRAWSSWSAQKNVEKQQPTLNTKATTVSAIAGQQGRRSCDLPVYNTPYYEVNFNWFAKKTALDRSKSLLLIINY